MQITNAQFAKDINFLMKCTKANVLSTSRQASKFRMKKGIAYKVMLGEAKSLKRGYPGAIPPEKI